MSKSYNIASTKVCDGVRVSSAAIYYNEFWGQRWQFETWIFSDRPEVKSHQFIHGNGESGDKRFEARAKRCHRRLLRLLQNKVTEKGN